MVDAIRSSNALWEATDVSENKFANYTDEQLGHLLGTDVNYPSNIPEYIPNDLEIEGTPANFDSGKKWPGCVHDIRD